MHAEAERTRTHDLGGAALYRPSGRSASATARRAALFFRAEANRRRKRRQRTIRRAAGWIAAAAFIAILLWLAARALGEARRDGPDVSPSARTAVPTASASQPGARPTPRPAPGAPSSAIPPADGAWRITIHHTATPADRPGERVRAIRDHHVRINGWSDIGYHLLVGEDGSLWFGRPLAIQGAHVKGLNERNIGLAFIDDFAAGPRREPSAAALETARAVLDILARTYGVPRERIYFHRDLAATECPGSWDKQKLFEVEIDK